LPALFVMSRLAIRVPSAVGVKVTFTVALLPGATVMGSAAELNENSAALVPPSARLEITRGALPGLLIVNGVGALVVFNSCAVNVTLLATEICGAMPVPETVTTPKVAPFGSWNTRLAVRNPTANGLNVTLIDVVAPAATVMGRTAAV
jgi:hypothetical protein